MSCLDIRTFPDPVLLQPAETVAAVDREVRKLMDDLAETMYRAPGVGLAAPQVGIPWRVVAVDVTSGKEADGLLLLANPTIILAEGEEELDEGCLSIPDYSTRLVRPSRVVVEGFDQHGRRRTVEGEGLLARALQHEIDHTRGVLFIDHLRGLRGEMVRKKLRKRAVRPLT